MKTIIIGLGNPILTDDSVGIKAARLLKKEIQGKTDFPCDVSELSTGGMRLMDTIAGYEKAIIIDSVMTQSGAPPGTIYTCEPSDIFVTNNSFSSHDTTLTTCLQMGTMLGIPLPTEIKIWAIEVKDVHTFSEHLTEEVQKSVPRVVDEICEFIGIRH